MCDYIRKRETETERVVDISNQEICINCLKLPEMYTYAARFAWISRRIPGLDFGIHCVAKAVCYQSLIWSVLDVSSAV